MLSFAEKPLMFQSWLNVSQSKTMIKDILSFTGIQRIILIFTIVILFWILFIIIYFLTDLVMRVIKNYKKRSVSNSKVSRELIISLDQHGSIRTLHRSDSYITLTTTSNNKQSQPFANHLTINHHPSLIDHYQYQQSSTTLLEYYLKTYNPLQIDLTVTTVIPTEDIASETDTRPIENCSPLNCTNKQRLHQLGHYYVRLKEQEASSSTADHAVLPVLMITDCSNSQRLHTDIIEMNSLV